MSAHHLHPHFDSQDLFEGLSVPCPLGSMGTSSSTLLNTAFLLSCLSIMAFSYIIFFTSNFDITNINISYFGKV